MANGRATKLDLWERRKTQYANKWQVGLLKAPCEEPLWCGISILCPCCASFLLRKRALRNDLKRYECCAGALPCSGNMGESSFPELCLAMEVCCCFGLSVAGTRWMLQDDMGLQSTPCDNCIIGTMICLKQMACICNLMAYFTENDDLEGMADVVDILADILWWIVCACMQTQHKVQLDYRDDHNRQVPHHPESQCRFPGVQPPPAQPPPNHPSNVFQPPPAYGDRFYYPNPPNGHHLLPPGQPLHPLPQMSYHQPGQYRNYQQPLPPWGMPHGFIPNHEDMLR